MDLRELGIMSVLSDILACRMVRMIGTCARRGCGGNGRMTCEKDGLVELPRPHPASFHLVVHECDPSQKWKSWEQRLQLTSSLKRPSS